MSDSDRLCSWKTKPVVAHLDQLVLVQVRLLPSQHRNLPLLNLAERADEREQGRLAGAGGAGHHHELARADREAIVEKHLVAGIALAEMVVHMLDTDDCVAVLEPRNNARRRDASRRGCRRQPIP